jgi:GNAT superfamily N-acetyltransferase
VATTVAAPEGAPSSAGASRVRVAPVRTSAERRQFIDLPFRLHRDLPHWVPPLKSDVAALVDPKKHPFHEHAEVELFLARDAANKVVGRVAAIRNRLHEETHHEPVGFFGLFETENDPAVASALLDAAASWLRARGLQTVRGPANLSSNEDWGLLVEGYDRDPAVMMPYNPPYYATLLEGAGFRKAKDVLAYELSVNSYGLAPDATQAEIEGRIPERLRNFERLARERFGLTIRPFDKADFDREIERVRDLYNGAWEANWGFVPFTAHEFDHLAKQLKPVADFDLIAFVEVKGETAGFAIALPDLNQALKHMNGSLFPFGWAKGLWYGRKIDALRVLTLGVLPKYRRTGAAELLYLYLLRAGVRKGIRSGELSWILEDNLAMRTPMEKLGAEVTKRYRLYDRAL